MTTPGPRAAPVVATLVSRLIDIEAEAGMTPPALTRMAALLAEAAQGWPAGPDAGAPPELEGQRMARRVLWRSEEGDRVLGLVALAPGTPERPVRVARWSVVAGLSGVEVVLLFDRVAAGPVPALRLRDCLVLEPGRAVALHPGEIVQRHARGAEGGAVLQLRYEAGPRQGGGMPAWLAAVLPGGTALAG